jgi:membrane-associated PAP2 superfamily phosphatase
MIISVLGIFVIVAVALVGFGLYKRRWRVVLAGLMLGALVLSAGFFDLHQTVTGRTCGAGPQ